MPNPAALHLGEFGLVNFPVRFAAAVWDNHTRMNIAETHAAQVFLAHHDFVKGVALNYVPWPGLKEDITQQVFLEFMAKV